MDAFLSRIKPHPSYLGIDFEDREHGLHIDERLFDFSIDRSKEVERYGKLKEEAVDHHQIAHSHRAGRNIFRRHCHDCRQPCGFQDLVFSTNIEEVDKMKH